MKKIRIGSGAGFAGDRVDPAVKLAKDGKLDYLVFECLGERTVAAGQLRRQEDPQTGFDPLLETRMRAVLPHALRTGTRIITNSGAANPEAAAKLVAHIAAQVAPDQEVKIACLTGDSVAEIVISADPQVWETGEKVSSDPNELLSAHAYLGVEHVLEALKGDPDIVITGRLADPSLFLAPMVFEFGWALDDWGLLGAGTLVGHLLECAGQITGGYFADPKTKPVPGLDSLGFPFADVFDDGTAILGKLEDTGGILSKRTVKEQMLYEVADPSAYITPDVVADFTTARVEEVGENKVKISGATGAPRTNTLKVTLGYRGGWFGEGQISYAGPRSLERAQLAWEVVRNRLENVHDIDSSQLCSEFIGTGAAFRGWGKHAEDPPEVRLRVSGRVDKKEEAIAIGWEMEALYCAGPAAGGGARKSVNEVLAIRSALIDRRLVCSSVAQLNSANFARME